MQVKAPLWTWKYSA